MRTLILALIVALALTACDPAYRFNGIDISGKDYGAALTLRDQYGQVRRMADFRGKVVAVFFGYTQCPDVCPTNLALFQNLLAKLGQDAERLAVVFVTVDPERDSAERLTMYMNAFDSRFIALRGTPEETAQVAKAFGVIYAKQGDVAAGRYSVDHTASTYLFDHLGKTRLMERYGETPARIEADLRQLLAAARPAAGSLVSPGKAP
ncbi:MAG: SCO family protein [Uliginosibacterium sp.]|nr:SCO family protein [Uliginosibacterium sp.]